MEKEEFLQQLKDQPFSILSYLVYQYIADAIVEVKYVPGSKINTTRISEELGISRTPVRTALERLARENLVEQVGEKGFKVCQIDWQDCMALYDIREMVEGNAAYIASNTINEAQLNQLKQAILRMQRAQNAGDDLAVFEADNQFHEIIVRSTGNKYLIDMYTPLKVWIRRYQHSLVATGKNAPKSDPYVVTKHISIYRAIRSSYSLVAKNEMTEHIHHVFRRSFDGGSVTQSLTEREVR